MSGTARPEGFDGQSWTAGNVKRYWFDASRHEMEVPGQLGYVEWADYDAEHQRRVEAEKVMRAVVKSWEQVKPFGIEDGVNMARAHLAKYNKEAVDG